MTRALESAVLRGTEGTTFRALESYGAAVPAVYSDDFNRANEDLDANAAWTTANGLTMKVVSNHAASSPPDGMSRYNAALANDQWAEVDVTATTAPSGAGGPLVRRSSSNDRHYEASWVNGVPAHYELYKGVDGVYTQLGSNIAAPSTGTHKLRVQAEGSTIKMFVDNVEIISATDTAHTAGSAGLWLFSDTQTEFTLDNFRCGDLPWTP